LGKCYRIYDRPQDRLKQAFSLSGRHYFREFWALRGVTLEVGKGEMAGIVGRNGSGKSTLLQIICGILTPTTGSLQVHGRVAALLELGAGFNPEFTGRENVFLNGAILGMSREEICDRFNDIVAFSELEEFIDRPVKTYSSGMFVRLAFSVATTCEPDVLVVDEALAVGDEAFQRKCFSRLERIRERGATILFVSHSASTVVQMCSTAFLLDHGELLLAGSPQKVVAAYHKLQYAPSQWTNQARQQIAQGQVFQTQSATAPHWRLSALQETSATPGDLETDLQPSFDPELKSKTFTEYPTGGACISRPRITTLAGEQVNLLVPRQEYLLRFDVSFEKSAFSIRFGAMIKSVTGQELGGFATPSADCQHVPAGTQAEVALRFRCLLPAGVYFVNAGVRGTVDEEEVFLHRCVDVMAFRVLADGHERMQGMFDFQMQGAVALSGGRQSCATE
jgi:lipopolysaccharide transport system ATP-binding protein